MTKHSLTPEQLVTMAHSMRMSAPTPADLATFATAIGWPHVLAAKKRPLAPGAWTQDDIRNIFVHWRLWEGTIRRAIGGEIQAQKMLADPGVPLDDVLRELKTSRRTLRKWYLAVAERDYGGADGAALAGKDWSRVIVAQAMSLGSFEAVKQERDSLRASRARAGAAAKHKKQAKQKKQADSSLVAGT
jgi:hypothetical protein